MPRLQRAEMEALPALHLTPRDAEILMAVYRYRVLSTQQIDRLFFASDSDTVGRQPKQPGKTNTRCQYRLQLLYHYGYLQRDEQPQKLSEGRKPFLYWLDTRGAQVVEELLDGEELDWTPHTPVATSLFLGHLLATNDVRIALTLAAHKHNFSIATWLDDQTLKRRHMTDIVTLIGPNGGRQQAALVPDGYFVLDTEAHLYHHFVEIDLRTVTSASSTWGRRDWARKVSAYLEYYRSGRYQERYKTQGLRVLTVTTGNRHLSYLKAVTERVGGRSRFWFTTFERVRTFDVLVDPIWQVASSEGFRALTW